MALSGAAIGMEVNLNVGDYSSQQVSPSAANGVAHEQYVLVDGAAVGMNSDKVQPGPSMGVSFVLVVRFLCPILNMKHKSHMST